MASFATLRELAEQAGDQEPLLVRPLGEGALANVTETMRLLNTATRRFQAAEAALADCRIPFDHSPFRKLSECLDEAWQALQPAMLAHLDALDRQKGGAR